MVDLTSNFMSGEQVNIHYKSAGSGELMVFLHGFPEFWYQWRDQLATFSKTHFAVAPDLRGFNLSSKPSALADYSGDKLIEDIKLLCEHLGYDKMTLVGHDWGGIIAWVFAHYYPQYLDKLIILNAPHPATFERELHSNPLQQKASNYVLMLKSDKAEAHLMQDDYQWLHDVLLARGLRDGRVTAEDKAEYLQAWSQHGAISGMLNYYRAVSITMNGEQAQWDSVQLFPGIDAQKLLIDVPTLVIWGEQDRALLVDTMNGLEQYVADLTINKIPDATHWLVQEQGERINQMIGEFIAK